MTRLILTIKFKDSIKMRKRVVITIDGDDAMVDHFGEAVRDTVQDHNEKANEHSKWCIQ